MCLALPGLAAVPADPQARAALVGSPTEVTVQPAVVQLVGPRARQQLVVTGRYADGSVRDLTPVCGYSCEAPGLVTVDATGYLTARKNGASALLVQAGPRTVKVPLVVKEFDKPQPVSFRNEVIAAFNVGGCNAGACHGTPTGKGGFKLSLRGFDPGPDYLALTREVLGRRTDRQNPDASLILLKGLGQVPHEGGQRFQPGAVPVTTLRGWLAEGLQDDPASLPRLVGFDLLPGSRVQTAPARFQQLGVMAKFSDGSVRDATRLTVFSSSDPAVAEVNANGLVEFKGSGEVAILARYLEELVTIRLTFLEPRPGFAWSNPAEHNYVDKHVFAKLKMLSIPPADLCSDAEFVRRAHLDVCGVLPTADEVRAVPGRQVGQQAVEAGRYAAGASGVCRLLDAEMVRRAAQLAQDDSGQGHARLPDLAEGAH